MPETKNYSNNFSAFVCLWNKIFATVGAEIFSFHTLHFYVLLNTTEHFDAEDLNNSVDAWVLSLEIFA